MKISRRSFLKGLAVSTILTPALAQVAPSPLMVSMFDSNVMTEGTAPAPMLTAKMIKDLVRKLKRENYPPGDLTLSVWEPTMPRGEVGRVFGARIVNRADGAYRMPVIDDDPLDQWGFVSYKATFRAKPIFDPEPLVIRRLYENPDAVPLRERTYTWDTAVEPDRTVLLTAGGNPLVLEAKPFDPSTVEENRGIRIS